MSEVLVGILSAVVGFASGLLTPWVKWQIDKRCERLAYRRELVKTWRAAIDAEQHEFIDERSSFGSSAAYSSLRANMLPEVISKIEAPRTFYVGGGRGDSVRKQMLLDEVSRIEKQWGLL